MFSPEDCFSHLSSISTGVTRALDKWAPSNPITDLKSVTNAKTTVTSSALKCEKCFIQFSSPSDLDSHNDTFHSGLFQGVYFEQNNVEHFTTSNQNDSAIVNPLLVKDSKAKTCSKTTLGKTFPCKFCNSLFTGKYNYQRHTRAAHCKSVHIDNHGNLTFTDISKVLEDTTCPYCQKVFSRKSNLKRHIEKKHADDDIELDISADAGSKVLKTINKEKLLCKMCDSAFWELRVYKQHCETVHSKIVEIDKQGQQTFSDFEEPTVPYCLPCGKTFSTVYNLDRHIHLLHNAQFQGVSFEQNNVEHFNTSTQNNSASEIAHLAESSKAEKGSKTTHDQTLQCTFCSSLFNRKYNYQRHNRNVHCKDVQIDKHGNHTFTDVAVLHKEATGIKRTQAATNEEDKDDEEDMLPYCIPCGKAFNDINNLKRHLESNIHQQTVLLSNNNTLDISKLRCPLCNRIYTKTKKLRYHLRRHHKDYYKKIKLECFPKEERKNTYGTLPKCEICDKEFDNYNNLKKHTLTVHNKSFDMKCQHCGKAFTSIANLKKHTEYHIRKTHSQQQRDEEIKCTICNNVSSSSAKHDKHISVIHNGSAFCTCSVCKMTIRKQGFKRHMKRHRNDSRLKCSVCKILLRNHFELMKHKENHIDKENQFKCNVCFKTFTNQSKLKLHMYVHNANYIPLQCKMCDRKFYDQRILDKHMKRHEKGNPIVCSYCGKQFMKDGNLRHHISQKHLNKKPYVCKVCGKAFEQEMTLNRHALVHTGEKAFQCPICYRKFSQQASVKRHMVVHSGEKPYKCQYCDKRYSQTTYLHVHVKNHHADEVANETNDNSMETNDNSMEKTDNSMETNDTISSNETKYLTIVKSY